jgi:O-acetylhomoserine/O-acetylserine sulfhydrylase-like pyridoxal-dependent enzyme
MDKLVPSSGFDTNAVHAGQNVNKWDITPCVPPIYMSVSFELKDPDILSNKVGYLQK